ncbi:MAG: TonB-dependent receptor, partial [Spartobacteria bacterium]|nr:TonB-dependent receptor [Spartobacteria bacterium]
RNNHDVFAFNEAIYGRWVQTLGLRGHWDDEAESWEALPQIGVLCHVTEAASARARIGRGFRQPSFSELHLFPAHNTKLDPEDVWSYELALTYMFTPTMSVFINPFYMDVQNLIQQEAYANPPPQFMNVNSGGFEIKGVETGVDVQLFDHLNLTLHYTYTDIEDGPANNPDINREGKPEHVVNAVAAYRVGAATLSLEGEYVAGLYDSNLLAGGDIEKVDDFVVFDLKGSYRLNANVEVFGGIQNLFDEDYEQIPGYPMPGIMGYAGVKARL